MHKRGIVAVFGLLVLVLALALPMVPTVRAHAADGDPVACPPGANSSTCIPSNTTSDPSTFTPDPVTFTGDPTTDPVTGASVYPLTLSVPGLPVCFTGLGGGIVNAPCYYNSYFATKWNGASEFIVSLVGDFGPSNFPEAANGPVGNLRVQEGYTGLFLIENDVVIHFPYSFDTVTSQSFGVLDTRVSTPQPNQAPIPAFSFERVNPNDWGLWRFSSQATDPDPGDSITSQTWEFGDGATNVGATVIHDYAKPGDYTVTHRVVDSHGLAATSTQRVHVPAPSLHVDVSLPDVVSNRLSPGVPARADVTVSAGADGLGPLSSVTFVGDVLQSNPAGAVTPDTGPVPAPPAALTLEPGTAQSFDVLVHGDESGSFALTSTARAVDAAGRAVGPVTGRVDGSLSGLRVELRSSGTGQDTIDVVVSVSNQGGTPIEGLQYPGNGVVVHPEYVPDALRGEVTLVVGPTPPLPDRLDPGETREATFRFHAEAPGDVAVVSEVSAPGSGGVVSANDAGFIGVQKRALNAAQLKNVLAELAESELILLRARAVALQHFMTESINARLVAARARGALVGFPADVVADLTGPPIPYPEIDNVQLTAAAVWGMAKGLGRGVANVADFAVGTPASYYASIVTAGDFGQAAQDYADAGVAAHQTVDDVAYGAFTKAFQAYDAFINAGEGAYNQQQYTDLTEALNDEYKGQMLRYTEIAPALDEQRRQFDAYLDRTEDEILRDPYGWADKVTGYVGEIEGETLAGEAVVRGGAKLAESAITSYEYSRYGQSGAAITRLSEGETLESLGAGPTTSANAERLGGITEADQQKIQGVIGEVKAKFGVDLEIQARPSNANSVQYLKSELGAVGKPEIFKAKNISDVDVILGADPSALGKLGVFEPKLPPDGVLAKMSPELANEVKLRFKTQQGVWNDWNDASSKFAKNYKKASQPGGGTFEFEVPTAAGDARPNAPRLYQIEVGATEPGRNGTVSLFEKTTGKPIVSDIDFHGYFKTSGEPLDAANRGQIELFLQRRWKETGIAFGDHGATLNGFDWAGSGTGGGAVARHKFGLEFMEPEAARARAQELSVELGVPVEKLLEGYVPGKFVVTFRRGQVAVGYGKTF